MSETRSVTIRLPTELVSKCDAIAARRRESRTWVIKKAIQHALKPKPEAKA